MARLGGVVPLLMCAALALEPEAALGQANIDAGKSPAQIFSITCAACHRSPRELRPTSAAYLREHYSTGSREAAAMAGYLAAMGSDARAVQQRRPPALGAGQGSPAEAALRPSQSGQPGADQANGVTAKPRRPSENVELGRLPINGGPPAATDNPPPQTAAVPVTPHTAADAFEE